MEAAESDDLLNLLCGAKIGEGEYRTVFACHLDARWVVKHDSRKNFSNIAEWEMWTELEETPLGKWLAPVEWLSPAGFWLIQRRTEPLTKDRLPKRVPSIFSDTKLSNWGWLDGRPVCHDYGNHRGYRLIGKHGREMRSAEWGQ